MTPSRGLRVLLCTGVLAFTPIAANAQLDHLVCYKALDKTLVAAAFDAFAELQPEFTAKGCSVVKVDDFCVPATKLNVKPSTAAVRADIKGPALNVDYIGYLVRCAKQVTPPNKVVIDQFGVHRQGRYKVWKVYVPAKKGAPECGTIGGRACGGTCPDATDQCVVDPADAGCKCMPAVNGCGGKPDAQGMCGGACTDPNKPQCQLSATASGAKICECGPPPPPVCGVNAATGTCGGECPNKAEKCTFNSAHECTCAPATTPCALVPGTVPVCGGGCPITGDTCTMDTNGNCACGAPTPTPCGQNPLTGVCGGECGTGAVCSLDTTGKCTCSAPPCGSDAAGQCNSGTCPNSTSQTCKADASGACNCDPPSCGATGANTCGGICPNGTQCTVIPGSAGITCLCR